MASSSSIFYYAAIAHGRELLVEYEPRAGARAFAQGVLQQADLTRDRKTSYTHSDFGAHVLTVAPDDKFPEGLGFLVVTQGGVSMRTAFMFLVRVKSTFDNKYLPSIGYGDTVDTLARNGGLLKDIKSAAQAVETGEGDNVTLAQSELDQVRNIMVENVDRLLERGERINLLVSKTDQMNENAVTFRRRTGQVARHMWWQNVKFGALVGAVAIVFIYFALGFVCGLPSYSSCRFSGGDDTPGDGPVAGPVDPGPEPGLDPEPTYWSPY